MKGTLAPSSDDGHLYVKIGDKPVKVTYKDMDSLVAAWQDFKARGGYDYVNFGE